jgi:hypothetical protein
MRIGERTGKVESVLGSQRQLGGTRAALTFTYKYVDRSTLDQRSLNFFRFFCSPDVCLTNAWSLARL